MSVRPRMYFTRERMFELRRQQRGGFISFGTTTNRFIFVSFEIGEMADKNAAAGECLRNIRSEVDI